MRGSITLGRILVIMIIIQLRKNPTRQDRLLIISTLRNWACSSYHLQQQNSEKEVAHLRTQPSDAGTVTDNTLIKTVTATKRTAQIKLQAITLTCVGQKKRARFSPILVTKPKMICTAMVSLGRKMNSPPGTPMRKHDGATCSL